MQVLSVSCVEIKWHQRTNLEAMEFPMNNFFIVFSTVYIIPKHKFHKQKKEDKYPYD